MMNIRHATHADLPMLRALGERGYAESRYGRYPLRPEKFDRIALLAQDEPGSVICLVAEENDEVIGLFCGLVTEHYFAAMIYATSMALYVVPEHRGSFAAFRLIRMFEREAKARGAVEILLGATSGVAPERTLGLFSALGYEPVGGLSVKYLGA